MARILAVDDERAILDALARVLGRDGHEVVKAADPTAGFPMVRQTRSLRLKR